MAVVLLVAKPLPKPMLICLTMVHLGTQSNDTWIKLQQFSIKKMHLKMLSGKWHSFLFSRACLFSKSSLAWLQKFWNSSICLYEIKRTNLFKSTCPTGSFTCPGLSGSGKWRAMFRPLWFNSLWASDIIWSHRSGSTLAQVMAGCCQATSHYLNQCWLITCEVLWHSSEANFAENAQNMSAWKIWI